MNKESESYPSLNVKKFDNYKKILFFARELLLNNDIINITASTNSAGTASRTASILVNLGYATYGNIHTDTIIEENKRKTRLVINLIKTDKFLLLYQQNIENKKKWEMKKNSIFNNS